MQLLEAMRQRVTMISFCSRGQFPFTEPTDAEKQTTQNATRLFHVNKRTVNLHLCFLRPQCVRSAVIGAYRYRRLSCP